MIRRTVWALAILTGVAMQRGTAQSFTFVAADTLLYGALGSEIVFEATITNTSSSILTLALVRTVNALPPGWTSSMCFDACFPPETDSIATTPTFGSSPLQPNESRPFSVHVYPVTVPGTGTVRIVAKDVRNHLDARTLTFTAIVTGSHAPSEPLPSTAGLLQNYPNPFNARTVIGYEIRSAAAIRLTVLDLLGREIAVLAEGKRPAGLHVAAWDASGFPSGAYVYRLRYGDRVETRRMLLLR